MKNKKKDFTGEDLLKILALVGAGYLSYKIIKIALESEKQRQEKMQLENK